MTQFTGQPYADRGHTGYGCDLCGKYVVNCNRTFWRCVKEECGCDSDVCSDCYPIFSGQGPNTVKQMAKAFTLIFLKANRKEREVLMTYTRHSHLKNHWKRAALKGLDDTSVEQKIDELLEKIGTESAHTYFE